MQVFTLDRIPAEIWEEICQYACTDGGFTGRSLSCTSRATNQQTKRMKHYSLAITKTNQLVHLAEMFLLQQVDPELQGIRHLFVVIPRVVEEDLAPEGSKKDNFPEFPDPFAKYEDEDEEGVPKPEDKVTQEEEFFIRSTGYREDKVLKAFRFILFNCPKLRTLFVHCSHRSSKDLGLSELLVPLPSVTRLSIHADHGLGLKTYNDDPQPDLPWFPSLRYFRISAGQDLPFGEDSDSLMADFVTTQAPKLTHARVWTRSLPQRNEEFQRLLDRFPNQVTTAIIEINSNAFHTRFATADEALFRALGEKFTFAWVDGDENISDPDEMRKYWEEEIQGMDGSWQVKIKFYVQLCPCHRCSRKRQGFW